MTEEILRKPVCRLCLSRDDLQVSIFSEYAKKAKILQMIKTCLPITISKRDGFSETICYMCLSKLKDFYEFHNLSLATMHTYKSGKSLEKVRKKIEKHIAANMTATIFKDSGVASRDNHDLSLMDTYSILRASPSCSMVIDTDPYSLNVSFLDPQVPEQRRFKPRKRRNQELF